MKPQKQAVLNAAINLTPQYTELLRDLQRQGGRISFSSEILSTQNRLGSYVMVYEDEQRIGRALFLFLLGDEGFQDLNKDLETATPEEQQAFLDEVASFEDEEVDEMLESIEIPRTPKEWQAAREKLEALPEAEKKEIERRGVFFWYFFFSTFFNTLSLMVHGTKMTTLVPLAIAGDDTAFLKAIQIDRMLLLHHPYFRDRKLKAQSTGEPEFLSQLLYRETKPPLQTKIRYPGLYMLFGILESFQWLDDLKHEEILDIADAAGLDRYQNRIEDVNYLTKRLIEYRRWQKSGGLSMH